MHFEFVEGVLFGWLAVRDKGNCSSRVVKNKSGGNGEGSTVFYSVADTPNITHMVVTGT